MDIMEITVKQWLTRAKQNPVPCRTMKGEVKKHTAKAVLVNLEGFLKPSTHCLHCHRPLTNKISLLYGLGPVCGGHFYINPLANEAELEARYEEMCKAMASVKYEGWIPKSAIENMVPYVEQSPEFTRV